MTTVSAYANYSRMKSITFSALTLLVGQQEGRLSCKKIEWWDVGMVICLE